MRVRNPRATEAVTELKQRCRRVKGPRAAAAASSHGGSQAHCCLRSLLSSGRQTAKGWFLSLPSTWSTSLTRIAEDFSLLWPLFKNRNHPWNYDLNVALYVVLVKTCISLSQITDKKIFPNPSISIFYYLFAVSSVLDKFIPRKQEMYGYGYYLCAMYI